MTGRRVVATGLGALTSIGHNVPDFWRSILDKRSGIGPIESFDASMLTSQIAGEVRGFDAAEVLGPREARHLDRFTQFAIVAGDEAMADAGLDPRATGGNTSRYGVVVGTGIGGLHEIEAQHRRLMERGANRVQPYMIPKLMANACSGQLAIRYGLHGPNCVVSAACASATVAIAEAVQMIVHGEADVVITGGTEAAVSPLSVGGFCAARALSKRNDDPELASRPFDKDRDGFVMGEGAGLIVLESYEHARKRDAQIYAEIIGYGLSCDAFDIVQPEPEGKGAAMALRDALKNAEIDPTEVDYINTHGTSTLLGDVAETKAINRVFGDHAKKLAVNSTKSYVGHLLGGSGGVEMVATLMEIRHGVLHPTLNLDEPDPECNLDYIPGDVREHKTHVALSNSFGFGGHNATVVVKAFEE
jgi:3-oxoacyl-[acyl-carrier-protein] synthase II